MIESFRAPAVEPTALPVGFDLLFQDAEHLGQIVVLRAQLAKDFDHWFGPL